VDKIMDKHFNEFLRVTSQNTQKQLTSNIRQLQATAAAEKSLRSSGYTRQIIREITTSLNTHIEKVLEKFETKLNEDTPPSSLPNLDETLKNQAETYLQKAQAHIETALILGLDDRTRAGIKEILDANVSSIRANYNLKSAELNSKIESINTSKKNNKIKIIAQCLSPALMFFSGFLIDQSEPAAITLGISGVAAVITSLLMNTKRKTKMSTLAPAGMIHLYEFYKTKGIKPNKVIEMKRNGFYVGRIHNEEWYVSTEEIKSNSNP
jgi:hypothetical protein